MSVTIHHYRNFFLLLRTFKIYSLSNFQICNIVLAVVTICTWHLHDLIVLYLASVQFSLSVQFSVQLCDSTDCSMPGFPVHHQLPEFAQTHVHRVGDAIQPSHPLSSPSPPAFNLSQHQGLFQWVSSSHQVAKVLEFQLWQQSFQWIFRTSFF